MVPTAQQAKDVFLKLADRVPQANWEACLEEECGGDEALKARVRALLQAHAHPRSYLDDDSLGLTQQLDVQASEEAVGQQIGPYKLLEVIGEGGMGTVFMAEQSEPVSRRVALKVIKAGMDTRQVVARFEAERQALAVMDHPNIAKVLDGGSTDSGRPYFVMELVKGKPITEFCDERKLGTESRLKLFQQVCHAVQHAHQKGIIHRDIKPSNVLVAMYDDKPVPKVIDFGVAKATADKLTDKTMFTRFGQIVGTLEYMSPEQAQFNQLDIDTRSDVYSLGAILCELLIGEPPFNRKTIKAQALDETLRMIREDEPTRPSTKLRETGQLSQIAANRRMSVDQLSVLLRGELDWIVMKSLEKDRSRRYSSAQEVSAEIDRYLANQPVLAGPPSAYYRFRKFSHRNKSAFAFGSILLFAVLIGLIGTSWQAMRASRALRDKSIALDDKSLALRQSEEESEKNRIMRELVLQEIIDSARPRSGKADGTVREAMFIVEEEINQNSISDEKLEAWLRHNIAKFFTAIGEYAAAKRNFEQAYEWRSKHPEDEESLIETADELSKTLEKLRDLDRSIQLARDVAAFHTAKQGRDSDEAMDALGRLASRLMHRENDSIEAIALFEEITRYAGEHDDEKRERIAQVNLGVIYFRSGRFDKAQQLWTSALKTSRQVEGPEAANTLAVEMNLANLMRIRGEYEDAAKSYQDLLPRYASRFGEDHPETIRLRHNLAETYYSLRRYEDAVALLREVVSVRKSRYGSEHGITLASERSLCRALLNVDAEEAQELSTKLVERYLQSEGGDSAPSTLNALSIRGIASQKLGDFTTAVESFEEIVRIRRKKYEANLSDDENSVSLVGALCNKGNALSDLEKHVDAVSAYTEGIELFAKIQLETQRNERLLRNFAANCYHARSNSRRLMGEYQSALLDLETARELAVDEHKLADLSLSHAKVLAAQGFLSEASELSERVLKTHPEDGSLAYEVAAVFCIASKVASNRSDQYQEGLSAAYVDKCFDWLNKAKELGEFSNGEATKVRLETNLDFEPIRSDPRYEAFIAMLAQVTE